MDPATPAVARWTALAPRLPTAGEKVAEKIIERLPQNAGKRMSAYVC